MPPLAADEGEPYVNRVLPIVLSSVVVSLLVGCSSGSDGTTGPGADTNTSPTAELTASPSSPSTGETVTLDASGTSDPDGSIAEYRWDVDGDGTVDQTTTSATVDYSYSAAGTVEASVTVEDDDGATDQATTTVDVSG